MKIKKAFEVLSELYRELKKDKSFSNLQIWSALVRSVFYGLFCQEEFDDMICYNFIKFKHPEIYETTFTRKDNAALLPLVNDKSELPILRKKHLLLDHIGDVERRYFYLPNHSEEEFAAFLREGGEKQYILKPDGGAMSKNMFFLRVNGDNYELSSQSFDWQKIGLKALYRQMSKKDIIIEEYINQHNELNKIFSGCVNTLFIHTVRLPDGHAEAAGMPYMEFGCGTSRYVNSGNDMMIGVRDDGTLYPFGFLRKNGMRNPEKITRHPDSGVVFDGFKIPYWDKAVQLAVKCAEKLPQLTYIKWDIAITDDGPVIIEGNGMSGGYRNGQVYSLEARGIGVKAELSEFLQALAFSKTLTPEKIEEINRTIPDFDSTCSEKDCRAVVVLGSARVYSRIEAAYNAFGNRSDVYYILCGGNPSVYPENPDEPYGKKLTEAECMKRYLTERGVAEERIIMDNTSKNTTENLACAAKVAERLSVKDVALVSSWFHGRRVKELLSKTEELKQFPRNICFIPAYGGQTKPDNWFESLYGIKAIHHEWKNL